MTETTELAAAAQSSAGATGDIRGPLSALRLPELQAIASQLGISGTARMRKSDLLEAIRAQQNGAPAPAARPWPTTRRRRRSRTWCKPLKPQPNPSACPPIIFGCSNAR